MNAMSEFHDLETLLAPVSPANPCGTSLRHDPVFTEIRLLREEDDPSLPMGQWERPLRHADWPRIERLCTDILSTRSKDLQLASWLAESWMRQRGFGGLVDGLRLIDALLQRYWPQLHPIIEDDGDNDARLAPLEWLNESLTASVRLHAVLFTVDIDKPLAMTLAGWERLTTREIAGGDAAARGASGAAEPHLSRADIHGHVGRLRPSPDRTGAVVGACLGALRSIIASLQDRLHDEAPNLTKLETMLEAALRVLLQFEREAPGSDSPAPTLRCAADAVDDPAPAREAASEPLVVPAGTLEPARWRDRHEAYATLEALADYLSEVEPHSPTPFLVRRAASWGRMSLPEVIADILSQEGDVSRFFQIRGIKL